MDIQTISEQSETISKIGIYVNWLYQEVINSYGKSTEISRIETLVKRINDIQDECEKEMVKRGFNTTVVNFKKESIEGVELKVNEKVTPLRKSLNMESLGNIYDYVELVKNMENVNNDLFNGKNQKIDIFMTKSNEIHEILDL
jgi:hypothetical protein